MEDVTKSLYADVLWLSLLQKPTRLVTLHKLFDHQSFIRQTYRLIPQLTDKQLIRSVVIENKIHYVAEVNARAIEWMLVSAEVLPPTIMRRVLPLVDFFDAPAIRNVCFTPHVIKKFIPNTSNYRESNIIASDVVAMVLSRALIDIATRKGPSKLDLGKLYYLQLAAEKAHSHAPRDTEWFDSYLEKHFSEDKDILKHLRKVGDTLMSSCLEAVEEHLGSMHYFHQMPWENVK